MRSSVSALAPFFRSDAQGRVLGVVLLSEGALSMSDIAASASLPLTTVQREVARLADAGVLSTVKQGNARLVSAASDYPLLAPLSQIVAATYGPLTAIREAFEGIEGAERVAVFGSWAARLSGEPGPFPADVDVLVVGDVSKMGAYDRAGRAGDATGREVNVTIVSAERWERGDDGFVREVKERPMVDVLGGES